MVRVFRPGVQVRVERELALGQGKYVVVWASTVSIRLAVAIARIASSSPSIKVQVRLKRRGKLLVSL